MARKVNYFTERHKLIRLYLNTIETLVNQYEYRCILQDRKLIIKGADNSVRKDGADHSDILFRKFQYEWNLLKHNINIYKANCKLAIQQARHDGDDKLAKVINKRRKVKLSKFAIEKKKIRNRYYILMSHPLKAKLHADRHKATVEFRKQLKALKNKYKLRKKKRTK